MSPDFSKPVLIVPIFHKKKRKVLIFKEKTLKNEVRKKVSMKSEFSFLFFFRHHVFVVITNQIRIK